MTRLSVFAGPTLAPRRIAGVDWYGPAAAGDLLQLGNARPHAVLLIDGLFGTARAPWHKEVLVLLANGFEVFGAASIGALRAAELLPFGMRPVGAIARAYCDGRIIGDDEVAVAHAPADLDYRALSVAHVDVRATLLAARRRRLMSENAARALLAASRRIHFTERSWADVVRSAEHVCGTEAASWIAAHALPYKQLDAEAALALVMGRPPQPSNCAPPPETIFLRRLRDQIAGRSPLTPRS